MWRTSAFVRSLRLVCATSILLAALVGGAAASRASSYAQSKNVSLKANVPFTGATELAFSGNYVYAAQMNGHTDRGQIADQGGVHILDVSGGKTKEVGFLHCPGNDNDIAIVKPGLLALGYHQNICNPGQGVTMVDVSKPSRPVLLGSVNVKYSHTITAYPGKPIVYVSPGGLAYSGGPEQIVDVSDPRHPEVVATYGTNPNGCHDFSFHISEGKNLGFCAGGGWVEIWDVTDPLKPTTISRFANPALEFPHYAEASDDGKLLAINDEAFVAHECDSGQSPVGSLWFYDISDPTLPVPVGHYSPPRGAETLGTYAGWTPTWCTSHQFSFLDGSHQLVVPWFTGGTSVLELEDPSAPKELAYFQPSDAIAYSADQYRGRFYITDMNRGLDVLTISGLSAK